MGFEFSETMSGTVEWDAEPGQRHPFRLDVTAHAESIRKHAVDGIARMYGRLLAPPKTRDAEVDGTITIRPLLGKIIRYELGFTGDDGKPYEIVGQKDISFVHPFKTFTTLPAEIVDGDRRRVGTCLTRFDLRRDWWRFILSFRARFRPT
jgi:hypothetical protein